MRLREAGSTAAAVLLTGAVVLTAGCSGGGDGTDAKKHPSGAASSPSTGKDGEQGPPAPNEGMEDGGGEKGDGGGEAPKVPTDELSPATGTFGTKEKKYLVDRVPKGTDPAAILEAGTAACERIGTVADADRRAVISALKTGEIANAEPAVEHLCPEYEPLLRAAGLK